MGSNCSPGSHLLSLSLTFPHPCDVSATALGLCPMTLLKHHPQRPLMTSFLTPGADITLLSPCMACAAQASHAWSSSVFFT